MKLQVKIFEVSSVCKISITLGKVNDEYSILYLFSSNLIGLPVYSFVKVKKNMF
jgi:hypothetical protein